MGIVKKISEFYKPVNTKSKQGKATIILDKGECSISSDTEIMGIEIDFKGKAIITPKLPQGWYLRGSESKIIMFTMQNVPIKDSSLFHYQGTMELKKVILANTEAKQFKCIIKRDESNWGRQDWSLSTEAGTWENFKDITPDGKVKKTSFIIDDDLPEVVPTKKTKKQIKSRRRSSGGGY